MNKLCLGTVKIGVPSYGYSSGLDIGNHNELFERAVKIGLNCFDTSPRYENSEKIIGDFIKNHNEKLFISTKIDNLNESDKLVFYKMRESVLRSIEDLNVESIDLCYLHQNDLSIISNGYVLDGLNRLKQERLIKNSGTSIYSRSELSYTLESDNYDWVQIPVNILDTSFYNSIVKANSPIKVSARSIFLLGIFFNEKEIKKRIHEADTMLDLIGRIKAIGIQSNLNLFDICTSYIHSLKEVDQILIGTTSVMNLEKFVIASELLIHTDLKLFLDEVSAINKSWTNPRNWKQGVT